MLLTAYLEMFHGSTLLNCQLRGCKSIATKPTLINCNYFYMCVNKSLETEHTLNNSIGFYMCVHKSLATNIN